MKWSLITGAAKGLGAAISFELASRGYSIVIQYNTSKIEALEVAAKCRELTANVEIIQGNFSTPQSTQRFIDSYLDKFSDTKNLINNVGNYCVDTGLKTPISTWIDLYQVNLFAPLQLTQALVPAIKSAHGSILNIGVTGIQSVRADTHATAYTATKLSLCMATKSLAKELIGTGVRVNMVSPGYMENALDLPEDRRGLLGERAATLSEVALVVSFLLDSEKAAYITGQNLEVGGGFKI